MENNIVSFDATELANRMYNASKFYLTNGFSVIPTDGGKRAVFEWKPFQQRKMTLEEVERLFSQNNAHGIALVGGAVSGNFEVIDVDLKNDSRGSLWDEFTDLIRARLPEIAEQLVITETINKGFHIYYRCANIGGNTVLAKNEAGKPLIETRGEGGYIIGPPTPGYKFIKGTPQKIKNITPQEREELFRIARSFDESKQVIEKKIYEYPERLTAFDDFNQRGDGLTLLKNHGWKVVKQVGDRIHLERPGKNENKTSATFDTRNKIFYPFTTSTAFEAGRGYNLTGVYTLLEHQGDFSAASRQLFAEGYGDRNKIIEDDEVINPDGNQETPLLPIDGFPKFIRDYIVTCSESYQTPRDYWAGAVIMATALGIGNKIELSTRYKNLPIFWMVLVGDVSAGKSHPIEMCLNYFHKLDGISIEKYRIELQEYDRAIKRMDDIQGLEKPSCFQYILSDMTKSKGHNDIKR